MKIIRPTTVTESILTATNVAEADEAEWASGTTYAINNLVMVTGTGGGAASATHKIYKSVQNANTGHDPTTDNGTWWTEVSSTNRWKMFNEVVQEQTTNSGTIAVTLQSPDVINSIGLINVDCTTIDIVVTDATDGEVYNETYSMVFDSGIQDWYAYFFEPILRDDRLAVLDIPPYANAEIDITLTDAGTPKCGALVIGQYANLGFSQHGASLSIIDYSTKSTDTNGKVTVVEGPFANRMEVEVVMDTGQYAGVQKALTLLRSTPAIWVADENNSGSVIYGYYREFDIVVSNPTISRCYLEIEGLV